MLDNLATIFEQSNVTSSPVLSENQIEEISVVTSIQPEETSLVTSTQREEIHIGDYITYEIDGTWRISRIISIVNKNNFYLENNDTLRNNNSLAKLNTDERTGGPLRNCSSLVHKLQSNHYTFVPGTMLAKTLKYMVRHVIQLLINKDNQIEVVMSNSNGDNNMKFPCFFDSCCSINELYPPDDEEKLYLINCCLFSVGYAWLNDKEPVYDIVEVNFIQQCEITKRTLNIISVVINVSDLRRNGRLKFFFNEYVYNQLGRQNTVEVVNIFEKYEFNVVLLAMIQDAVSKQNNVIPYSLIIINGAKQLIINDESLVIRLLDLISGRHRLHYYYLIYM